MAKTPSPAKRYIVAALAGIVAAAVIVSVISAILRPGEIHFSITHASNKRSDDGWMHLNLTLAANNTSHRAGARYHSVLVYLEYYPNETTKVSIAAEVFISPPLSQPAGNTTTSMDVSASLSRETWMSDFAEPAARSRTGAVTLIGVLVVTMVRFKVGPVYTRRYEIRVLCDAVDYFGGSRPRTPIHCGDG